MKHTKQVTKQFLFPTVKIDDFNAMINRKFFFDQSVKNDKRTYDNIRKIATYQADD